MEIGLALPQYAIDAPGGDVWTAMRAAATAAEAAGLDAIWLSDHPFALGPDGVASGALEPLACAGALIRTVPRVRVGTLVLTPTMRSAALTASVARTIGGSARDRFVAGLGTGWYEPEHRAFGLALPSYDRRVALLSENLAALRALGRDQPRILCGGTGRGVLELAARHADAWNIAWDVTPETFAAASARLDELCTRAGRDPATLARTAGVTVLVAENERGLDRAVERLRGRASFLRDLDRRKLAERIVWGTPEACAERIASYRVDGVIAALLLRDDRDMIALFGGRVATLLRGS